MAGARVSGTDLETLVGYLDDNGLTIPGTSKANKGEFATLEVNTETGVDGEIEVASGHKYKFKGGILYEVENP